MIFCVSQQRSKSEPQNQACNFVSCQQSLLERTTDIKSQLSGYELFCNLSKNRTVSPGVHNMIDQSVKWFEKPVWQSIAAGHDLW